MNDQPGEPRDDRDDTHPDDAPSTAEGPRAFDAPESLADPEPGPAVETVRSRRRVVLFTKGDDQDQVAIAEVLRMETVGGVLMLAAAVLAVLWANFGGTSYDDFRHLYLGPLNLQHWAADGLLAIFFFVVGLELKRELVAGSLRKPSAALVPIMAAVGGMVVPALLYLAVNSVLPDGNSRGWAVPMATDIAFALAILGLVARGLPTSLRAFLLTLAIVDDIGAITVIAVVFTTDLAPLWLIGAAASALVWWLLQRYRLDTWWWLHVVLFVVCWFCMWSSGVHATIAGVILGLLTRTSPDEAHDPVDRWEHFWRPVSAGVVVPLFALLSAGVTLDAGVLGAVVTEAVPLGIILGLVLGKLVGITGAAWLTARFTRAELAPDIRWGDVAGISVVAGVGFTVALLVAELAFADAPEVLEEAKTAVLLGSVLAGVLAAVVLGARGRSRARLPEVADAP
ncbi:Na+/H+ antiporter NhaA [Auraticoccus monumenti]|uniref:Na(+)/H(+) antiporter NhaA n=1 Tax=Auraticoccus monumenti TaxID=675864 RepID=A0A1G6S1N6_9ACTN|nr:Na+/H+ antiporter NhaA [Auraticoccus monumenti]SDD10593.1 sodium/proton antiporter, NhaA family [Auraticoccus monumenti]